MKHPLLLACAESLLLLLHSMLLPADLRFWASLWLARCSVVHYRCLLGNPSASLHKRIRSLQEKLELECERSVKLTSRASESLETGEEKWRWILIRVLIEEGLFYLYSFETEKANPFFLRAMDCFFLCFQ